MSRLVRAKAVSYYGAGGRRLRENSLALPGLEMHENWTKALRWSDECMKYDHCNSCQAVTNFNIKCCIARPIGVRRTSQTACDSTLNISALTRCLYSKETKHRWNASTKYVWLTFVHNRQKFHIIICNSNGAMEMLKQNFCHQGACPYNWGRECNRYPHKFLYLKKHVVMLVHPLWKLHTCLCSRRTIF